MLLPLCFSGGWGRGTLPSFDREIMEDACLALLAQAITLSSNVNRGGVMQEAVQQGGGKDIIRYDVAPFAIGFITSQDDAALLIPAANQAEEKLS